MGKNYVVIFDALQSDITLAGAMPDLLCTFERFVPTILLTVRGSREQ
jgi:hypothetical protein